MRKKFASFCVLLLLHSFTHSLAHTSLEQLKKLHSERTTDEWSDGGAPNVVVPYTCYIHTYMCTNLHSFGLRWDESETSRAHPLFSLGAFHQVVLNFAALFVLIDTKSLSLSYPRLASHVRVCCIIRPAWPPLVVHMRWTTVRIRVRLSTQLVLVQAANFHWKRAAKKYLARKLVFPRFVWEEARKKEKRIKEKTCCRYWLQHFIRCLGMFCTYFISKIVFINYAFNFDFTIGTFYIVMICGILLYKNWYNMIQIWQHFR